MLWRHFGLAFVIVIVALLVREWYPISRFPMYKRHSTEAHWFYVTNGTDEVLPYRAIFGRTTVRLKKVFHTRFDREKNSGRYPEMSQGDLDVVVGEIVLRQSIEEKRGKEPLPEGGVLKLWRGEVLMRDGEVERRNVEIAKVEFGGQA